MLVSSLVVLAFAPPTATFTPPAAAGAGAAVESPVSAPAVVDGERDQASAPDAASLEAEVGRILEGACVECHGAGEDLDLAAAPSSLLGKVGATGVALVAPGEPDASYLLAKIVGAPGIEGEVMPLAGDPLSDAAVNTIRDWITALGASSPTTSAPSSSDAEVSAHRTDPPGRTASTAAPATTLARAPKGRAAFHGTHQINLHTTTTLGRKSLEFRVHHRFGRVGVPFRDRTYLGMAGGAVMSLGVAYGIVDGLDVMARWTNSRLDWELGTKYVPVRQEAGMPLSFGMYASFEAITEKPEQAANRFTGNVQAMLSRLWFDRWSTQLTVGYAALTNHSPTVIVDLGDGPVYVKDPRGTLHLGIASTVWIGKKKKHGIDLEYNLPIPDGREGGNVFFYNGGDARSALPTLGSWAIGWSARAGLHFFQVFVSNTRNIHTNLYAPGGDTLNPFKPFGDFFFGFNISRKWVFGQGKRRGGTKGGVKRGGARGGAGTQARGARDGVRAPDGWIIL
jgi:mono/diheme cytochrome c family protein